jgi:NAD(P)H-quinone oxidoreductase subunit 5
MQAFYDLFMDKLDPLALIMIFLIGYIGICVLNFSSRYMKGDLLINRFFVQILLLIATVVTMVSTNNLVVLFFSASISNFLLVNLMIHKSSWRAAKSSGIIAAKNYFFGACCLAFACSIFYYQTGEIRLDQINQVTNINLTMKIGLGLLLLAALSQSAIWPFHRWLLSSLNSPTPVSAIMHAGLINGGGFLIVKFAPLYLQFPEILNVIFIIGLLTALLGTLWKLIQSDVKRMLACSTMGQMGFMFVQCGLGLFPLAIAHLFWHGLFKAYLFLASGSAAQEKRCDNHYPPKMMSFIFALCCGAFASFCFAEVSEKSWLAGDSTLVLLTVAFIACTQLALTFLPKLTIKNVTFALVTTTVSALFYGFSVHVFSVALAPLNLMHPQPLNVFHFLGIFVLSGAWVWSLFFRSPLSSIGSHSSWALKGYVMALNASQPHPKTITAHRNHYQYL